MEPKSNLTHAKFFRVGYALATILLTRELTSSNSKSAQVRVGQQHLVIIELVSCFRQERLTRITKIVKEWKYKQINL